MSNMTDSQGIVRLEGVGQRDVAGAFATLMALSSEAVLVFDDTYRVLAANEEATRLICCAEDGLTGADVRYLFERPGQPVEYDEPRPGFDLSGTSRCSALPSSSLLSRTSATEWRRSSLTCRSRTAKSS